LHGRVYNIFDLLENMVDAEQNHKYVGPNSLNL
jgi:hypothetical protein